MRSRLLIFGYPLLEIATIYVVALWIGWGWTLLLVLAGIPIGFAVMRNAGDAAMRDMEKAARTGEPIADSGRHALTFVGGLMFLIPGFWTDLLGLLLVLPPTQRLFRRRSGAWVSSRFTSVRMPGVHYPAGDVIQGTVIRGDEQRPAPEGRPPQIDGPPS
jgi:UPF0716 protein FxsA